MKWRISGIPTGSPSLFPLAFPLMSQLFNYNRLVVNQKAKLIEITNQFAIRDEHGNDIGFITQEGQSTARKVLRFVSNVDQFLTHNYTLYDATGQPVMHLTRPAKVMKSTVNIGFPDGSPAGQIIQQNVFGKIRFGLLDNQGQPIGEIRAENWRAWNFAIVDTQEHERARITKKFGGVLQAAFTTADNYLVEIDPSLDGALRFMTFAAAAAVDTALKQDE